MKLDGGSNSNNRFYTSEEKPVYFDGMIIKYNHELHEGQVYVFDKNKTYKFFEGIWRGQGLIRRPCVCDFVRVQLNPYANEINDYPRLVIHRERIEC